MTCRPDQRKGQANDTGCGRSAGRAADDSGARELLRYRSAQGR